MHGTYVGAVARGDNRAAALISKRASARFADEGDPTCRLILHRMAGIAAFQAGKFREARQELQAVLELYDPVAHGPLAGRWGHDVLAAALGYLTHIVWLLGYPDQACRLMEKAFETARQISHSGSIGQVHYSAGVFFAELRRDPVALKRHVDETVSVRSRTWDFSGRRRVLPRHLTVRARHASRRPRACGPKPGTDAGQWRRAADIFPWSFGEGLRPGRERLTEPGRRLSRRNRCLNGPPNIPGMRSCAALPGRSWLRRALMPAALRRCFSRRSRSRVGKARRVWSFVPR